MKIAFLCHSIFNNAGVQRIITTLANELCDDYEIDIICTSTNIPMDVKKYNLRSEKIKVIYRNFNMIDSISLKYYKALRGINI